MSNSLTVCLILGVAVIAFFFIYDFKLRQDERASVVINEDVLAEFKTNLVNYVINQIIANWPERESIKPEFTQFNDDVCIVELENEYRHVLFYFDFAAKKVRICYYWEHKGKDCRLLKTFRFPHDVIDAEKLQTFSRKPDAEIMERLMKQVADNLIDQGIDLAAAENEAPEENTEGDIAAE